MKLADIEWRDDGQLRSRTFDDIYFSGGSQPQEGLQETLYVFLQQNDLPQRFSALNAGATFVIGETGFGTGLNFLATWDLWLEKAPASARLHFISVEKYPLHLNDLRRALALWPRLQPLSEQLIGTYPPLLAEGVHRLHYGTVALTLVIGEASEALRSLRLEDETRDHLVDAWFLDGFAPSRNPAMWTPDLFGNIAALSRPGATFATFTCAGLVKRGLRDVGFAFTKVPGFGRKREILRGSLRETGAAEFTATPWHLPPAPGRQITVAVIGAGISGATAARTLAQRGLQVHVFDQAPHPGAGASGNDQGILYAKLSPKPGPNGDFNLHALMFAQRYYRAHCAAATHFSGLLQLAQDEKTQQLQRQIGRWLQQYKGGELARLVDAGEAGTIAGLPLDCGGLYFPRAGWLEPREVCATLLRHDNIRLHCNTGIEELIPQHSGWLLRDASLPHVDAVVICTANGIRQFAQTAALPLRPMRGQVSHAAASVHTQPIKTTLCGKGYITPVHHGSHSFGATFKLKETGTEIREEEHRENLQTLAEILPQVAKDFSTQPPAGRASLRAATPDYLPMAGPVPDWNSIDTTYAGLRKNRKRLIPRRAAYQPNLYVLGGLGSRGFTYAPLAAEVLAAWICGEVMPIPADLAKALHPARFAIRALGRDR